MNWHTDGRQSLAVALVAALLSVAALAVRLAARGPERSRQAGGVAGASTTGAPFVPTVWFEPADEPASSARFLARGTGRAVLLDDGGASVVLPPATSPRLGAGSPRDPRGDVEERPAGAVVTIAPAGVSGSPRPRGERRLAARSSTFIGDDPSRWRAGAPCFAAVRYPEVYPGIDLVYYGIRGGIEHDFVVAPGANPGRIKLAITGAAGVGIDDAGDLRIAATGGDLTLRRPTIYQEIAGARRPVDGGFVLDDAGLVGFCVGAYDRSASLVIDPTLAGVAYLGGSSSEWSSGIAVDHSGHIVVVGFTGSGDFPVKGALQPTKPGILSTFVARFDAAGQLDWATFFGGTNITYGYGVAVAPDDTIWITGATASHDLPLKDPIQPQNNSSLYNAFLAHLSGDGTSLLFSTYYGGSGSDSANRIAVDGAGRVALVGTTSSSDFPTVNAFQSVLFGRLAAFALVFDSVQRHVDWATLFGGEDGFGTTYGSALALDDTAGIAITGQTTATSLPTKNASRSTLSGASDGYLARFASDGFLSFATYLGGSGGDRPAALVYMPSGSFGQATAAAARGAATHSGAGPVLQTPWHAEAQGVYCVAGGTDADDVEDVPTCHIGAAGATNGYVCEVSGTGEPLGCRLIGAPDGTMAVKALVPLCSSPDTQAPCNLLEVFDTTSPSRPTTPDALQPAPYPGTCSGPSCSATYLEEVGPDLCAAMLYGSYLGGPDYTTISSAVAGENPGVAFVLATTIGSSLRTYPTPPATIWYEPGGEQDASLAKLRDLQVPPTPVPPCVISTCELTPDSNRQPNGESGFLAGVPGLAGAFTDQEEGACSCDPKLFEFAWGDGTIDSDAPVTYHNAGAYFSYTHAFTRSGSFKVKLTVTCGEMKVTCQTNISPRVAMRLSRAH